MEDYTELTVNGFLDAVSERTPAPGGGGVAAAAGALACAMGRMVAAYSTNKRTSADVRERVTAVSRQLEHADRLLRTLIVEDARAYQRMTEAGKTARTNRAAQQDHQAAILAAIGVPMEMAALASRALEVLDEFKADASSYLLSDLGVAAVLADATTRAAAYSVAVNAADLADERQRHRVLADITTTVAHGDEHRAKIEAFVRDRLRTGPP